MKKLDILLVYLDEEWGEKVANEFLDKLEEKIKIIKSNDGVGGRTKIQNIRSILVGRYNKVYYRVKENEISIINLYDTRRNPKKNPFNLPK